MVLSTASFRNVDDATAHSIRDGWRAGQTSGRNDNGVLNDLANITGCSHTSTGVQRREARYQGGGKGSPSPVAEIDAGGIRIIVDWANDAKFAVWTAVHTGVRAALFGKCDIAVAK